MHLFCCRLHKYTNVLGEETEMMDVQEEMETIESEEIVVQPEIGAQEVEIVTERPASPEEILPDIKSNSKATVPPLRPLTIAPKPPKVPVQFKPVSGQQLLLVQGKYINIQLQFVQILFFVKVRGPVKQ